MEKKDTLNNLQKTLNYDVTDELVTKVINDFVNDLDNYNELLVKANKIDINHNKKVIDKDRLKEIVKLYSKSKRYLNNNSQMVLYAGDPYLTVNLCMQAFLSKTQCIFLIADYMVGVNKCIVNIFDTILEKYKIKGLVSLYNNISNSNILKLREIVDGAIIIGETSFKSLVSNAKFFSYNNIGVYSDSDDFEELQNAIYEVAVENEYEIEVYYEETKEDVLELIDVDEEKDGIVILSLDEETKQFFKDNIKNKKLYINENPFKEMDVKIIDYLK